MLKDAGEIAFWNLFIQDTIASHDATWRRRLFALQSHTQLLRASLEVDRASLSVKDRARLVNVQANLVCDV